jgi:hypothetical protein
MQLGMQGVLWRPLMLTLVTLCWLLLVVLSQVAFIGFAVQALASRTQPIEGLMKHLGNPGYNITYTLTHL